MPYRKRKKSSRMRGETTHGYGSMKKNRGAGHRGGRGRAGSGKRGDCKKPMFWKERYFGKYGFKKKGQKEDISIVNLSYIEEHLDKLLHQNLIQKDGEVYVVDIKKLGFNKLLATGKVTKKFKIATPYSSNNAVEKIKAAGGEVIVQNTKQDTEKS